MHSRTTALVASLLAVLAACAAPEPSTTMPAEQRTAASDEYARARREMVAAQIRGRGVTNGAVLRAMEVVPRHRFVPPESARLAYEDHPLPIGHGQTISQPYIVAYMTEALEVDKRHKVLEVGTGSGYQAAVLGEVAGQVFTIEIVEPLGVRAKALLRELEYGNVHVRIGDGYGGWPEQAPFDRIIVTAAPDHVPQPLIDQLAVGGRMVIPVGRGYQELLIIAKTEEGIVQRRTIPVRFVPLTRKKENPS